MNLLSFGIIIYKISEDIIFSVQHVPYAKTWGKEGAVVGARYSLKTLEAK